MKTLLLSSLAVAMLAGCASTRIPEADRLALYQAHAGEPVKQIRNYDAIAWDKVDGSLTGSRRADAGQRSTPGRPGTGASALLSLTL